MEKRYDILFHCCIIHCRLFSLDREMLLPAVLIRGLCVYPTHREQRERGTGAEKGSCVPIRWGRIEKGGLYRCVYNKPNSHWLGRHRRSWELAERAEAWNSSCPHWQLYLTLTHLLVFLLWQTTAVRLWTLSYLFVTRQPFNIVGFFFRNETKPAAD